mmetsp:Transcript_125529/g.313630  ORF Transcript_125529/g.313630 Transcript_125529/m.313630 type:complete len:229 (+) Transcript_125529:60-746(+)
MASRNSTSSKRSTALELCCTTWAFLHKPAAHLPSLPCVHQVKFRQSGLNQRQHRAQDPKPLSHVLVELVLARCQLVPDVIQLRDQSCACGVRLPHDEAVVGLQDLLIRSVHALLEDPARELLLPAPLCDAPFEGLRPEQEPAIGPQDSHGSAWIGEEGPLLVDPRDDFGPQDLPQRGPHAGLHGLLDFPGRAVYLIDHGGRPSSHHGKDLTKPPASLHVLSDVQLCLP